MDDMHNGSCNCGAVRFRTSGKLREIVYCHCSQCRKQSGHFFAATSVAASKLAIEGEEAITWYAASPEARRGFCHICGTALFWKQEGGNTVSILAGAFDKPTGLKGSMHIFAADKGDYYAIDDGLPVHPQWWPAEAAEGEQTVAG
ncbi:GFA family protein [Mesorhizobium sp. IMUNJ 23232]|uniref:GFA family protein n=1 Tax=Mesorhizobium sp. IMUNJ 23232 TaxID=3376064 RepID=UPI0037BB1252